MKELRRFSRRFKDRDSDHPVLKDEAHAPAVLEKRFRVEVRLTGGTAHCPGFEFRNAVLEFEFLRDLSNSADGLRLLDNEAVAPAFAESGVNESAESVDFLVGVVLGSTVKDRCK